MTQTDAGLFYKTLYHTGENGILQNDLRMATFCPEYKEQKTCVSWFKDVNFMLKSVELSKRDIHLQVALSNKVINKNQRCDSKYDGDKCIAAFPAVFADIDCYKMWPNYKPGTIPEDLRSVIEFDEIKPTAYINTGGGIHAWWIFDKLFITDTPEKRQQMASILLRFGRMLASRGFSKNIQFDNVFDISRVLRIIGSNNYKKDKPRECKIISFDPTNLFMVEQIEDICDAYTETTKVSANYGSAVIDKKDPLQNTIDVRLLALSEQDEEMFLEKLDMLCESNEEFRKAFQCYGLPRQDNKVDISKFLQKLAYHAAAASEFNLNFSDTEIFHIFKIFIKNHGVNDEHYQDNKRITKIETFVKPTIKKARVLASEVTATNELKRLSEKPIEEITNNDIKKIHDTILRLHGFSLKSFTKVSDGSYEIATKDGLVVVPTVEHLTDQKRLQNRFIECIDKTFQPIKGDAFRHTLNMLFRVMQHRLADPEKDFNQQITSFLIDYILQSNDLDQPSEDLTIPERDKTSKRWKVLLEVFCKWLKNTHGISLPATQVSKSLLTIEAERNQGRFHGIRRHHWVLPLELTIEIDMVLKERDIQMKLKTTDILTLEELD